MTNKDQAIPLADLMGSIEVGENPNSAIFINNFKILCKGIYDPDNLQWNTFSSLSKVDPWNMELDWNVSLGVYNAKNLSSNSSGSYISLQQTVEFIRWMMMDHLLLLLFLFYQMFY